MHVLQGDHSSLDGTLTLVEITACWLCPRTKMCGEMRPAKACHCSFPLYSVWPVD